jgi:hypothetical protein
VPDIIEGPVAFLAINTPRRNPKDLPSKGAAH